MDDHIVIVTLMNVALAAIGLSMIALGLRGLISRRPFLIRAVWVIGPLFVAVILSLIPGLTVGTDSSDFFSGLSLLVPITVSVALLFILMVIFLGQFGTYIIFGVKQEDLRDVILYALARLDIPHIEMLNRVHLPMHNADLQVMNGWLGTAQIRIRPRNTNALLDAVANEMGEIFNESKQASVPLTSVLNLILGVLLLITTVMLTTLAAA